MGIDLEAEDGYVRRIIQVGNPECDAFNAFHHRRSCELLKLRFRTDRGRFDLRELTVILPDLLQFGNGLPGLTDGDLDEWWQGLVTNFTVELDLDPEYFSKDRRFTSDPELRLYEERLEAARELRLSVPRLVAILPRLEAELAKSKTRMANEAAEGKKPRRSTIPDSLPFIRFLAEVLADMHIEPWSPPAPPEPARAYVPDLPEFDSGGDRNY